MSRATFHLSMWLSCFAIAGCVVAAFVAVYGLMGVIEPELMFGRFEWGALNHNESYCRLKKDRGFGYDPQSPPRSFREEVTRERLAARQAAREKVREEHVPIAVYGGLALLVGAGFYVFLLLRLVRAYRPRPDGPVKRPPRQLSMYLWCVFALGCLGSLVCTIGVVYGAVVIGFPDLCLFDWELGRGNDNEAYWIWIGQAHDRNGRFDLYLRPSDDELTRARLQYREVQREQYRDFGRVVIGLMLAGSIVFGLSTFSHRRLLKLVRSWRSSAMPNKSVSDAKAR